MAFVDIAPSTSELEDLVDSADHLVILDHHLTNQQRILGDTELMEALNEQGHEIHFDLTHSGAVLAWQYFLADQPAPELLLYVEDQDLWNWRLPDSEAINAAISSYPHEFDIWDRLATLKAESLAAEGAAIVRNNLVEVERALRSSCTLSVLGRKVEGVNARTQRSAIGHALAERRKFEKPWGCAYRIEGTRVHATLYSIGDFNVAHIAGQLSGGGHRNAAGFSVSLARWLTDFCV